MNTSFAHIPACISLHVRRCKDAVFTLCKEKIEKFLFKDKSWDYQCTHKLALCSQFEPSQLKIGAHVGHSCPYADLKISFSPLQLITVQSNLPLNHHLVPHIYENPTYITPSYISYIAILATAFRGSNVHTKRDLSASFKTVAQFLNTTLNSTHNIPTS